MTLGCLIQSVCSTSLSENFKRLDVELLLSHVLCCERMYLYTHWDRKLNTEQIKEFQFLSELRKTGMPIAYIVGKKEFYGYEFVVKHGVFIPRPETETLVSAVLSQWDNQEVLNIMDFGSGSGCVGLTLLVYFPKACLISVDSNEEALKVGRMNAENMGVANRVVFLNRNVSMLSKKDRKKMVNRKIDIIVANPPYIAFDDDRVTKEVVSFEPPEALFSSERGLYHIRSWLSSAAQLLKKSGSYFFEIGARQDISSLDSKINQMRKKTEFRDMSNIIRVIQFQKCNG